MDNELHEQLNRIEKKLDTILASLTIRKKDEHNVIQVQDTKKDEVSDFVNKIYAFYKVKINKKSRLIKKAEQKIKARLKEYKLDQLLKAIENFSKDDWWMKHNAHRGVAWFFHSEERVEQFLNLVPQKGLSKVELNHNDQPCRIANRRLQIYAPWSGQWLDWNKNHPQFEKFVLKDRGKIIFKGRDAYQKYLEFHEI